MVWSHGRGDETNRFVVWLIWSVGWLVDYGGRCSALSYNFVFVVDDVTFVSSLLF